MAIAGIDHFNLRADRDLLARLQDFYATVLGLSVGPRPPFRSFGYWLYAGEKDVLHLTEERPEDRRRPGSDLTFDHIAFNCSGLKEYETRLHVAGIAFERATVPATDQIQLFFRDPAGNGVELNFTEQTA